jgi:hypothetical protein
VSAARYLVLYDGDSPVAEIRFQAVTIADFDASVDVAAQVFLVWVANVIWRQN